MLKKLDADLEKARRALNRTRRAMVRVIRDVREGKPNAFWPSKMSSLDAAYRQAKSNFKLAAARVNARETKAWLETLNKPNYECMEVICDELNDDASTPWLPELRRLVSVWQQSGPNIQAMFEADRELQRALEAGLRPVFWPTQSGRAYIYFGHRQAIVSGKPVAPNEAAQVARSIFAALILSPFWDRLGGPCLRCKKYFMRKTAKRSIYCSRRCASQNTAIEATLRARQQQRDKKLALAERATREWETLSKKRRTKKGWKEWVAAAYPEITTRFLTRAVNQGELRSPATE